MESIPDIVDEFESRREEKESIKEKEEKAYILKELDHNLDYLQFTNHDNFKCLHELSTNNLVVNIEVDNATITGIFVTHGKYPYTISHEEEGLKDKTINRLLEIALLHDLPVDWR